MKLFRIFELAAFFAKELVVANWQVALCVLRPNSRLRPAIIRLPLDLKSEAGIVCLANMITLTPGTLTLQVARDQKALFIHVIHTGHPTDVKSSIKQGFERRLIRIFDQ